MKLTPDVENANRGTQRGARVIRQSLTRLKAGRSIVVDGNGNIIAGNKTYAALRETLGREPVVAEYNTPEAEEADVLVIPFDGQQLLAAQRTDLDLKDPEDMTARELAIADNRAGELSLQWDIGQLQANLEVLDNAAYLFDATERASLAAANDMRIRDLTGEAPIHLDDLEVYVDKWGTEVGQVWQMGPYARLGIGDSRDKDWLGRIFAEERANFVFTSPPYWVGKEYERERSEEEINAFIRDIVDSMEPHISREWGRIVINTGSAAIHRIEKSRRVEVLPLFDIWRNAFRHHYWLLRNVRIWAKSGDFPASIAARSDVVDQRWEHLLAFGNEAALFPPETDWSYVATFWSPEGHQRGQNKIKMPWAQQGVWNDIVGARSADGKHIAAFPFELVERMLRLYTVPDELVFEPFSGSGTTAISCHRYGRRCLANELSPAYAAASLERFEQLTRLTPQRYESYP